MSNSCSLINSKFFVWICFFYYISKRWKCFLVNSFYWQDIQLDKSPKTLSLRTAFQTARTLLRIRRNACGVSDTGPVEQGDLDQKRQEISRNCWLRRQKVFYDATSVCCEWRDVNRPNYLGRKDRTVSRKGCRQTWWVDRRSLGNSLVQHSALHQVRCLRFRFLVVLSSSGIASLGSSPMWTGNEPLAVLQIKLRCWFSMYGVHRTQVRPKSVEVDKELEELKTVVCYQTCWRDYRRGEETSVGQQHCVCYCAR